MYYDRLSVEVIQKNIEKSLKIHKIKCKVTLAYNCSAISVENDSDCDDGYLYIWIRLLPTYKGTYYVDVTNIILPKEKRRKGVFSTLFTRLNNCKYVEKTRIISVCSIDMQNWCKKNNLIEFNAGCFY